MIISNHKKFLAKSSWCSQTKGLKRSSCSINSLNLSFITNLSAKKLVFHMIFNLIIGKIESFGPILRVLKRFYTKNIIYFF
jgi:hypothetical protein